MLNLKVRKRIFWQKMGIEDYGSDDELKLQRFLEVFEFKINMRDQSFGIRFLIGFVVIFDGKLELCFL